MFEISPVLSGGKALARNILLRFRTFLAAVYFQGIFVRPKCKAKMKYLKMKLPRCIQGKLTFRSKEGLSVELSATQIHHESEFITF